MIAVADQGRALSGLGPLTGSTQTLPILYSLPSYVFHDITTGFNGYEAGPGYDLVSGLGSPKAQLVSAGLGGVVATGDYSFSSFNGITSTSQTVATFENPGGYTVHTEIDWGDGSPDTTGTIVGPSAEGLYQLDGTHDYAKQGNYEITVHISFGPAAGVAVDSAATVSRNIGILLLDPTGAGAVDIRQWRHRRHRWRRYRHRFQQCPSRGSIGQRHCVRGRDRCRGQSSSHSGGGGFVGPVQTELADPDPLTTLAAPPSSGPTFKNTSSAARR